MDSGVVKMDLRVLRIDWQKSVIFCVSSTVAKWMNGILCLGVIKLIYKKYVLLISIIYLALL